MYRKWSRSGKNVSQVNVGYLSTFISAGTIGILDEWNFMESPSEIASLIEVLVTMVLRKLFMKRK